MAIKNLTENNLCPRCGAPLQMDVSHSCQDSEKNEFYGLIGDSEGGCVDEVIRQRKWDKEMEGMGMGKRPNFEKGSIIDKKG